MEKIDFIKKCAELADGFRWFEDNFGGYTRYVIEIPDLKKYEFDEQNNFWPKTIYPLLIRLAAEALHISFYWNTEGWYWGYTDRPAICEPKKTLSEAMTAALEYIFEQEEK